MQNRRELQDAVTKVEPQGRNNRLDSSQLAAPKRENRKVVAMNYGHTKVGIRILMAWHGRLRFKKQILYP